MNFRRAALLLFLCGMGALLTVSFRQFAGFRSFHRYERLRAETGSLERGFPALEAALDDAIRQYAHPAFYQQLSRLYFDRALSEDKSGDPAGRDEFLDKAAAATAENIRFNPLDSWAYFEMGKIWMMTNAPLLTYADKGRLFLRRALELNPAHDFLNLEALYFHLSQWDMLEEAEKRFVWDRIERKWLEKPVFVHLLRRQWIQAAKTDEGLKSILMSNPALWRRIAGDFK